MQRLLLAAIFICSTALADDKQKISHTLDLLHQYASEANWQGYFGLYHPDAIFIGTDAEETWTVEQFKNYARPAFDSGRGWTYHSYDRHIYLSPGQQVAWFDELLSNQSLGVTRGTGVLVKVGGEWQLTQYHLAIPVPNELADDIAGQIKAFDASKSQ